MRRYCWPGDETINALDKAVDAVAEADAGAPLPALVSRGPARRVLTRLAAARADDYIVIAITDANFDRYGITAEDLRRSITRNSKVHVALLAIGEGAETTWLPKVLPGKAYTVRRTGDLASTIRAVLSATLDKGL